MREERVLTGLMYYGWSALAFASYVLVLLRVRLILVMFLLIYALYI